MTTTSATGATATAGSADIKPRISPRLLQPLFERKFQRFSLEKQLSSRLDETGAYAGQVANLQTNGDALRFVAAHVSSIALFEAEALSSAMEDLRILPGDRLEQIVDTWPWSLRPPSLPWSSMGDPSINTAELFAPTVMADLIDAAGLRAQLTMPPTGVSREEVIAFIEERSPGRSMGYSSPVSITYANGVSRIGTNGEIASDCHELGSMLLLPANDSNRAYTIDGHQVMWLYASALSEDDRASARPYREGLQILSMLTSVGRGDVHRRLRELIVPRALKLQGAEDRAADERTRDDFASEVRRHVSSFIAEKSTLIKLPTSAPNQWDWASTARALDEAFAAFLEEQFGDEGKEWAREIRDKATRPGSDVWSFWRHRASGELYLICLARISVLREMNAKPYAPTGTRVKSGDHYSRLPKPWASVAGWASGGAAMREMRETDIDGDHYAPEPATAGKLWPRSIMLLNQKLTAHGRKPHQTVLPLEDHSDPLPVVVANAMQYAISPLAAKISLLLLANDTIKRGRLVTIKLGELVKLVSPSKPRVQLRELQEMARALEELHGLFMELPDGHSYWMFDVNPKLNDSNISKDVQVMLGLQRSFCVRLATIGAYAPSFSGEFLVNLSGLMRIPNQKPALIRHYIRAAANFNAAFNPARAGAFDANMLKAYSDDEWATIVNALSPGVVEYLEANSSHRKNVTRRKEWSEARKRIHRELDEIEGMGLVVVHRTGKGSNRRFKLLPPEAYNEAWRQARAAGERPLL